MQKVQGNEFTVQQVADRAWQKYLVMKKQV